VVPGSTKWIDEHRQIWFRASGMYAGKILTYITISGLTSMAVVDTVTEADANHTVSFSPRYEILRRSVVAGRFGATVSELHSTADSKKIADLERGKSKRPHLNPSTLLAVTKNRDLGRYCPAANSIHPKNIRSSRTLRCPQDSFVPKSFFSIYPMQSLAELGFIVIQIDGHGHLQPFQAFTDVCWKNLQDAGFPDRILWHKTWPRSIRTMTSAG